MDPPRSTTDNKKKIKLAELFKHNIKSDCWIAVRGKVYNVTDWIPQHPGGSDPIVLNASRDATQLFEAYHPLRVYPLLQKYYIGELEEHEYPQFPPMSQFYIILKQKIEEHFTARKRSPRYAPEILYRTLFFEVTLFLFHYLSVITPAPLNYVFAMIVGWATALICFQPTHEASHCSTTDSPNAWRLLGALHDFTVGASFYCWLHQHLLGHHPFTNVSDVTQEISDALDPDIVTNDPDIRRIKPHQTYYNHYKWQFLYAPLLYGLLGMKIRLSDASIIYRIKKNGKIRVNPMDLWHTSVFWGGKAFWVFFRLLLPAYYVGIFQSLLLFFIGDLVTSYMLAFTFQVNHVIPHTKWPSIDNDKGMINMDWAEMQIRTTLDYGHHSYWTTFFTGALNYQVVHHLFPYISQIYYPEIAPIVKNHCKQYKIEYNYLPTFSDAFKAHLEYLYKMGHAHYDF